MGINIKGPGKGDLTGTSKAEKKARAAKFGDKANAVVDSRIKQSENGFQGETKNEYGLPDGIQQVQTHVGPAYTGPKYRKENQALDKVGADKYQTGTKGIKTKGGLSNFVSKEGFQDKESAANYKFKSMDTSEIANRASDLILKGKGTNEEDDEIVRSGKEIAKRNGKKYSRGSKGIKIKGK